MTLAPVASAPKELHDSLDELAPFLQVARRVKWGVSIVLFVDKDGKIGDPKATFGAKVG